MKFKKKQIHVAQNRERISYPDFRIEFIYAACAVFGPGMQSVKFIKNTICY